MGGRFLPFTVCLLLLLVVVEKAESRSVFARSAEERKIAHGYGSYWDYILNWFGQMDPANYDTGDNDDDDDEYDEMTDEDWEKWEEKMEKLEDEMFDMEPVDTASTSKVEYIDGKLVIVNKTAGTYYNNAGSVMSFIQETQNSKDGNSRSFHFEAVISDGLKDVAPDHMSRDDDDEMNGNISSYEGTTVFPPLEDSEDLEELLEDLEQNNGINSTDGTVSSWTLEGDPMIPTHESNNNASDFLQEVPEVNMSNIYKGVIRAEGVPQPVDTVYPTADTKNISGVSDGNHSATEKDWWSWLFGDGGYTGTMETVTMEPTTDTWDWPDSATTSSVSDEDSDNDEDFWYDGDDYTTTVSPDESWWDWLFGMDEGPVTMETSTTYWTSEPDFSRESTPARIESAESNETTYSMDEPVNSAVTSPGLVGERQNSTGPTPGPTTELYGYSEEDAKKYQDENATMKFKVQKAD